MSNITKLVPSLAILALLAAGAAPAQKNEQALQKQAEEQVKALEKATERAQQRQAQVLAEEQLQKTAEQQNWPVKIFEIRQANSGDLFRLLNNVFRGQIKADTAQGTLLVRAPKELMPAIEDIVKRFDAPPAPVKNVVLTAYMVVAERAESNAKVPAELEPVVKHLKSVFPNYQSFRLLDTAVLRSREGTEGSVNGVTSGDPNETAVYQLHFRSARITSDEKGRMIWIDGLRFNARVPVYFGPDKKQFNFQDVGLNADVDLREDQKAAVGKAGISGTDRTLFLVLTAKVVD